VTCSGSPHRFQSGNPKEAMLAVADTDTGYINEILETATAADWQAVADDLIAEGHDLHNEGR